MAPWGDGPAEVSSDDDGGSGSGGVRVDTSDSADDSDGSLAVVDCGESGCPEGTECIAGVCVAIDTGAGSGDADDDVDEEYELIYPCDAYTDFAPYDHATLSPDSAGCAFMHPAGLSDRIQGFTYGHLEWGMGGEEAYVDGGPLLGWIS